MLLAGGGVALFVVTSALWLVFVTPGFDACRRHFGQDFLAFYVAGSLVNEGRHADLYDLGVVRGREQAIARGADLALGDSVGPWWNPPAYAWCFAPLARLPFARALAVWVGINLCATGAALWLLARLCRGAGALVPLLVLASAPFVQSLTHAQNTPISLLLLAGITHAWRNDRPFTAGALVGLLMYKPQLAAVLAVVLVVHRGRRAAAGLLVVASVILTITLVTLPGALTDFLHRMPANLHFMQVENAYLWERHVTLRAFWRLLLQGREPGELSRSVHTLAAAAAVPFAATLALAAWRARGTRSTDALVAAAVATTPLLMPFYFDYDLLLLAVPAVLAATRTLSRDVDPEPRARSLALRVILWSILYLWLFVNPYVGAAGRINLAVPLLAALAASTLATALRGAAHAEPRRIPVAAPSLPPSLKAA